MNASFIFFTMFVLGAGITYPHVVLKLLAIWMAIVAVKLVW